MNALASPAITKAAASDKRNRGELQRCSIEPAENGFTVRCDYAPKKAGKGDFGYMDPEIMVFETAKGALAYVKTTLEGHESYEGSANDAD